MAWLPADFEHPERVELATGHHLRPIRGSDVDVDYPATMACQPRLWSLFGKAWGWPPTDMTYQQDLDDLLRHEREQVAHESFNYAIFNEDESALFGCIYIDPPESGGRDAEICWWVIDAEVGGALDQLLTSFVPTWIDSVWPFQAPFIGLPPA